MKQSKSAFIRGLQCRKSLYLKKFKPELEDAISNDQQSLFDSGHEFGSLATKLFPGGVDLSKYIPRFMGKVFKETKILIGKHDTIYEAGFTVSNLLCFSDIVIALNTGLKIYEVKNSKEVKDVHLWDAAFQYLVISNSGYEIEDISIIHLNNDWDETPSNKT